MHGCVAVKSNVSGITYLINCAPAYGADDIVDVGNDTVWHIKGARRLNAKIRFALGACSSKPAININFLHIKFHI